MSSTDCQAWGCAPTMTLRDTPKMDTHLRGLLQSSQPHRSHLSLGHLWHQDCGSGRCDCPWKYPSISQYFPLQVYFPRAASAPMALHCTARLGPPSRAPTALRGLRWHRVLPALMPKAENHRTAQPSCHNFLFLVKKQFSKVGLSPEPPDTLTPHPVLTSQTATSRVCWIPCRPLHWYRQDPWQQPGFGMLRWWEKALPHSHHHALLLTNRYGDLVRLSDEGSFFPPPPCSSHMTATQACWYTFLCVPEKNLWVWLWGEEWTNCPLIAVLVYSNFWGVFPLSNFLLKLMR